MNINKDPSIKEKIQLIRRCFPKTWIRKTILLLDDCIFIRHNHELAGILLTRKDRITLLCVDQKYRGLGYASELLKKTKAKKTYTYTDDNAKFYEKHGFKRCSTVSTFTGKRIYLKRGDHNEN